MIHPSKSLVIEWEDKAEGDLEAALTLNKNKSKKKTFYIIAFHCQQAIEKYLKTLLLSHEILFPKTHDLIELLKLLQPKDPFLYGIYSEFKILNPYAVGFRYPGEDITSEELKKVIKTTKKLALLLKKRIKEFL
ncbi:HEPN domain-containing protein [Candidatus Saganbacteria bacterium]|nr:HEPN domain-containing protein [Candidatus Saganbacteria bacterium]